MTTITVDVDVDLSDFSDAAIEEEYEARNLGGGSIDDLVKEVIQQAKHFASLGLYDLAKEEFERLLHSADFKQS